MSYLITGLDRDDFEHYFGMSDAELSSHGAVRVIADADKGWPCRVSLEDAKAGENLILVNYTSHDVATPNRSSYAIYIRQNSESKAKYVNQTPPVFDGRILALRGFCKDGMIVEASLANPGQADAMIRDMFEKDKIAYIHAHNAIYGCFSAKVERYGN